MTISSTRTAIPQLVAGAALATVLTAGCGGAAVPSQPGVPGGGGGGSAGEVDPDACGGYAASDAGRKINAFLQATVWLQDEVNETEAYMKETCEIMAEELGMEVPTGTTDEVCTAVIAELDASLDAGLSARSELVVDYEPAVCEVNVDAAASAAAECEGSADAEVVAQCQGSCDGTCNGTCTGECEGGASADGGGGEAGGQCNGTCNGTCEGTCSGSCDGHADVDAEASCEAHAEVRANAEAECTEPEVAVSYDAEIVADSARLEGAVAAVEAGLPRMLGIQAKMAGPVKSAFTTWAQTAADLGSAGMSATRALGDQAMCVAGQLSAAAAAVADVEASISVQVEVSASASASAGGGA